MMSKPMTKQWHQLLICPTCRNRETIPVDRMTAPKPAHVVCDRCRGKALDAGPPK